MSRLRSVSEYSVWIISEPITDQSLWEQSDQKMTFELKEQALNAFASQMYSDLIVSLTVICYLYSENKRRTRKRGGHDEGSHHQNYWQSLDSNPKRPRKDWERRFGRQAKHFQPRCDTQINVISYDWPIVEKIICRPNAQGELLGSVVQATINRKFLSLLQDLRNQLYWACKWESAYIGNDRLIQDKFHNG